MAEWIPVVDSVPGPRYAAIVEILERDIASGALPPGRRLLPHRKLAERMGLSVGTVSKAYTEAERRGLISGEVGRGTFVRRWSRAGRSAPSARPADRLVDLALNVPPDTGEAALVAATLAEMAEDGAAAHLLGYLPHQGLPEHREAFADWFAGLGLTLDPARIFVTHGAQHALSIALSMVAAPGDVVLTEALTYSGMLALASQPGYRLHGVAIDAEGMIPHALESALRETGARVVYATPTLQTPTGAIMSPARRAAIAEMLRRHDAWLVEDDAYGFLCEPFPPPVSTFAPERSFYIASFAKCLAPGLRVGALVPPGQFRDRTTTALRSTGWMAAPVMAEVVARTIRSGALAEQVVLKRGEAARRNAVAGRILGRWLPPPAQPGFHIWLPLSPAQPLSALIARAYQAGIRLAAPGGAGRAETQPPGVRICLGAVVGEAELERALAEIARILTTADEISLV